MFDINAWTKIWQENSRIKKCLGRMLYRYKLTLNYIFVNHGLENLDINI